MKWYSNLKLRSKLQIAFTMLVLFGAIIGVVGIRRINKLNKSYSDQVIASNANIKNGTELLNSLMSLRVQSRDLLIHMNDAKMLPSIVAEINSLNQTLLAEAEEQKRLFDEFHQFRTLTKEQISSLDASVKEYSRIIDNIVKETNNGNIQVAIALLDSEGSTNANKVINEVMLALNEAFIDSNNVIENNTKEAKDTMFFLMGIMAIVVFLSVLLSIFVSSVVVKPITNLMHALKQIANGQLHEPLANNSKDEVGQLSRNFAEVVLVFTDLEEEMNRLYHAFEVDGDVEARIDKGRFMGDYKKIASQINDLISSLTGDTINTISIIKQYTNGDFEAKIPTFPGKKIILTQALTGLSHNLQQINADVNHLLKNAMVGNLNERISSSTYNGAWAIMANDLNNLMDKMNKPIKEAISVFSEMEKGNLQVFVEGEYEGEYLQMKQAINSTLRSVFSYVNEISQILNEMANKNFDLHIINAYEGDFAPIKHSLNHVISFFNEVIKEINSASDYVASGSMQIAQSSMQLAEGATQQSDAIGTLTNSLHEVSSKSEQNAIETEKANGLAEVAKGSAAKGKQEMETMLDSMNAISDASQNISKIIKVIEEIAFQTNLLAINAAVEAARAGQHGKGFAVVADQVRTLAARSKDAAGETATLIEDTVDKVNVGMRLANQTSDMLTEMVMQIDEISDIVGGVAQTSNQQADAVKQINEGVSQIAMVTQHNTKTSEATAASAQELSSQSAMLKEMIARFRLQSTTKVMHKTLAVQKQEEVQKSQAIQNQEEVQRVKKMQNPSAIEHKKEVPSKEEKGALSPAPRPFAEKKVSNAMLTTSSESVKNPNVSPIEKKHNLPQNIKQTDGRTSNASYNSKDFGKY